MGARDNQNSANGGSCYCKNPAVHGGSIKAHRQTDLKFKLIDYSECLGFAAYAGINVDVVVKQMAEVGFVSGEFCDSERAKKNVGEKVEVLS
jgi:hypothetical protein